MECQWFMDRKRIAVSCLMLSRLAAVLQIHCTIYKYTNNPRTQRPKTTMIIYYVRIAAGQEFRNSIIKQFGLILSREGCSQSRVSQVFTEAEPCTSKVVYVHGWQMSSSHWLGTPVFHGTADVFSTHSSWLIPEQATQGGKVGTAAPSVPQSQRLHTVTFTSPDSVWEGAAQGMSTRRQELSRTSVETGYHSSSNGIQSLGKERFGLS